MLEFKEYPKIPRFKGNGIIITEKIDGTNAQVCILPYTEDTLQSLGSARQGVDYFVENGTVLIAGSRTRWISLDSDNFQFCRWVSQNTSSLPRLGLGTHYGEWWGPGIQRGYGNREKVFSLFNAGRYDDVFEMTGNRCIRTVPVLYKGAFTMEAITETMALLDQNGSVACPGFMRPEGIVICHLASRQLFKYTFEGDHK